MQFYEGFRRYALHFLRHNLYFLWIGEEIAVQEILEGESNKGDENDKFNKVGLLVKNSEGELIIIEVQNNKEYDYFQRMLYGTSKVITEHIGESQAYANVKKVYFITIAYFDLGQGEDYVYHGQTEFRGIHQKDKLQLAAKQIEMFEKSKISQIHPEYWIIKADKFDNRISDKLDEWVYFLKNSEILDGFTAPGLKEAREKLSELQMSEEERAQYKLFQKRLRDLASQRFTEEADFNDLLKEREKKGLEKGKEEVATNMIK